MKFGSITGRFYTIIKKENNIKFANKKGNQTYQWGNSIPSGNLLISKAKWEIDLFIIRVK